MEIKITDEELVLQAQNGNKRASEELMSRHSAMVRRQVRGYFLMDGELEDLIQEGMFGLFLAISDYKKTETGRSFKNFAYLCVRRKILDALKRSATKKNQKFNDTLPIPNGGLEDFSDFDPDENLILLDEWKEIKVKIGKVLSDFEFKIFWMYMDGMTRAEICEATEKSPKSVDNALERSKKKLRELVKK